MKINKNVKTAFITIALVTTSFVLGHQNGEKEILNRWENRFDSDWYHWQDVEIFILGE
jgi:hypothetical protein